MKRITPVGPGVGGKKIEIICMSDVPGPGFFQALCYFASRFHLPLYLCMRSKMRSVRLKLVRVLLQSVNYRHKLNPALGKKNIHFNYLNLFEMILALTF